MKMKNKYYLVEVTLLAEIDKYSSWLHSFFSIIVVQ